MNTSPIDPITDSISTSPSKNERGFLERRLGFLLPAFPRNPRFTRLALAGLASICALLALAGCAGIDAANKEPLLSAAGFVVRTPETPKQKELYASAPANQLERIAVNGKVFYAYKDEAKGVAYVGGEAEYQRYQQLAVQQRIARDNYMAAEMNRDMATGWYGAYGPYAFGPHYRMLR